MNETSSLLNDYRCTCGKLLLKGIVFDGVIEIKCKRCGVISKIGEAKLIEDSSHYLMIINDRGLITNVSQSIYDILGFTPFELIGKSLTYINSSLPKEIGIKFFGEDSLLNKDSSLRLDTTHKTKSGKNLPVSVLLKLYSPTSSDQYILEYVTLKNNVNRDGEKLDDKDQFIENSSDYYFDIDSNGVVEYISESMEKLFKYSQEKVISKHYFDFLPFTQIVQNKNTFKHFRDLEQSYRLIQDLGLDSAGGIIHSDLYFTTKFDEVGKSAGYRVLGWVVD